jgi:DNA-binding transcriptional LysR family regulator
MRMTIDTIRQIDRGEVGRLRVGIVGSAMWGPIPSLLEQFQSQFPRVTWTLHELGPNEQWEALRAKQIDVGFWREPKRDEDDLKHANLRQELCFRENVCVAINAQHPLAKQGQHRPDDIAGEPMLTLHLDQSAEPRYLIQCCVNGRLPADDLPGGGRAADPAGDGRRGPGRGADAGNHQPHRLAGRALPADPQQSAVGQPVHHLHHPGRCAGGAGLPEYRESRLACFCWAPWRAARRASAGLAATAEFIVLRFRA